MVEIKERLLKGCKVLGNFWRTKERCAEGWKSTECACGPKTKFCKAKAQWVDLALQDGRMLEEGEYGVAMMMRAEEWDETGLSLIVDIPDIGKVDVGQKGVISIKELAKVTPETMPSILKIFKFFPDSQVTDEVFAATPAKPAEAPK